MSGSDYEEGEGVRVNVGIDEVFVDLHYPVSLGKGSNARQITRLRFRRPTIAALDAVARVHRSVNGNNVAVTMEIIKQIGADAEQPDGVLPPSVIGQIDVADYVQIGREVTVFFPQELKPAS